ncbi:ABC-ATPase domain-containing protein [Streptomyces buecherae]|uniref:ABC-ATPase domain-containing protein n=1 Tax=Streptomyces buecherae TaxID=2763006 RepID=UPI0028FCBDEC|nr:ABC-ATPase domain-containing protein [Streptomyces buecherae]
MADTLRGLEGASYGRYKSLVGRWTLDGFDIELVRAQADPFAPPARVALHVPAAVAGLPAHLWRTSVQRRALAAYLARRVADAAGDGILVDAGAQQVLDRASCQVAAPGPGDGDVEPGSVTLRLNVQLPGRGRRIDARAAERILCRRLPLLVGRLRYAALDAAEVRHFVNTAEDSAALRAALPGLGLVAFVADGAVLPRRSGVDDRALTGPHSVPFLSPPELRVTVDLPHAGRVTGMGLPEGVTLIVGGGFHGKSTLLRALETGVWDHIPGDGRELVVSRPETVKIRAEDGRRIERVDLHAFVNHLPSGADTTDFRTDNASGSTSQAATIVESMEAGAKVLLIDEDTAATNLMIRDARMQALVAKSREPLTPFVDLVRSVYRDHGISTVLVMGGSGDYMEVADRVIMMDTYQPSDVTARANELAARPTGRHAEADRFPEVIHRRPDPNTVDSCLRGRPRIQARGRDALVFGEETVDLRAVEQTTDAQQVVGVGLALEVMVRRSHMNGVRPLAEALDLLDRDLGGAGPCGGHHSGGGFPTGVQTLLTVRDEDFALPRRFEVAAALNRLRTLSVTR